MSTALIISNEQPKKMENQWSVRRLKYLARLQFSNVNKKTEEGEDDVNLCNYVDVYYNDFITSTLDFMKATATKEEISKFTLKIGDVLLTKDSETADDIGIPAYVAEQISDLVCGYHLAILRPAENVDGKYLFRFLSSRIAAAYFEQRANGITRFAIGLDTVGGCPIHFPPLSTQQAIASYLDKETSRIDALIAKKERQIELLEEKRRATITRAITKGLDSKAKMKDSGVEWIGTIPAHWDVRKAKQLAKLVSGHTPSRQHPEYWEDCKIPWFGLVDVWQIRTGRKMYVEETDQKISEIGLANSSAQLHPAGTVILSRTASVGFSAIMRIPMATTQDFADWICGKNLFNEYLYFVFQGMKSEFDRLMMGSTHQTIYMPDIEKFMIPHPPIDEQKRIAAYLEKALPHIEKQINLIENTITLLHEYRSSLITAAVSGQIDVSQEVIK